VAAARRLGVPCVLTFHSMLGLGARALGAADALGGWARGDVLVTGVSAALAAALRRALPHARVAVLPNATDVTWWRAAADEATDDAGPSASAAAPLAVPPRAPGELRLVAAMRLVPKKRPLVLSHVLAAAVRAAAPAGTPVRLVVAGAGSAREAMERAAARRGVADALTCVGWQPRAALRALYRDADAFVLPTRHESFGIAALEARAAGLPVLGMAGTGLADFVRDGVEGVLCADDAALARAAARLAFGRAVARRAARVQWRARAVRVRLAGRARTARGGVRGRVGGGGGGGGGGRVGREGGPRRARAGVWDGRGVARAPLTRGGVTGGATCASRWGTTWGRPRASPGSRPSRRSAARCPSFLAVSCVRRPPACSSWPPSSPAAATRRGAPTAGPPRPSDPSRRR
jgi:hypothetical protein